MITKNKMILMSRPFQWLVIFFAVTYFLWASFPFVHIENDSMRISLGAQFKDIYGSSQDFGVYRYEAQAGTYKLIEGLVYVSHQDYFQIFSILTVVLSILFIFSSAFFISRITNGNLIVALFSLFLFQEVYVNSYYPNSSIISISFFSLACLLTTFKEKPKLSVILSGSLFAIAVWTRLDAILLGLAFPFLIYKYQRNRLISSAFIFGTTFILAAGLLYIISDLSFTNLIIQYQGHTANISVYKTIVSYLTIFTFVVIFLGGAGLYILYKKKQWFLLALSLLVPLPIIFAYGFSVTTPKYLLGAVIFFTLPICISISKLLNEPIHKTKWIFLTSTILFFGQFIFTPAYELIFNRSITVYTDDGPRLRGSILYSPLYWRKEKILKYYQYLDFKNKFENYLVTNNNSIIVLHEWMANEEIVYYLQSAGYRIIDTKVYFDDPQQGHRLILKRGENLIYLIRLLPEAPLNLSSTLHDDIYDFASVLYIGPTYPTEYHVIRNDELQEYKSRKVEVWGSYETILFR